MTQSLLRVLTPFARWFDSRAGAGHDERDDGIDWLRVLPFIGMHLACFGVIWVGWSPVAVVAAIVLYAVRMFAITAFYHRYFSHRAFRTSRWLQLVFGVLGSMAVQRGPLWWAAHHRHHHRHADGEADLHSPARRGLFVSHMGWFLTRRAFRAPLERVRDFSRYRELDLIDRYDILCPVALAVGLFVLGGVLEAVWPGLGTSPWQLLVWGFFISTVVLFHATVSINSLAHRYGRRRYATRDDSRNNWWLALITFGEGWHNNHHHFPGSARQGFAWWEIDLTWYGLRLMAWLGLVWDLKPVPPAMLHARRIV